MSNFKGPYLRVQTPVTIDGKIPKIVNGTPVYKESHLALGAKKIMEKRNKRLPEHLRHIIEVVDDTLVYQPKTRKSK